MRKRGELQDKRIGGPVRTEWKGNKSNEMATYRSFRDEFTHGDLDVLQFGEIGDCRWR